MHSGKQILMKVEQLGHLLLLLLQLLLLGLHTLISCWQLQQRQP
jgi:hypothetical protein